MTEKFNNFKNFMENEDESELEKDRRLYEKLLDFYFEGKFNKPTRTIEQKIRNTLDDFINQVGKKLTQEDKEKIANKVFKKFKRDN
tara:strand:- start:65 stop:322 length:258 start_codon:yes stop_codon:yes gene_type:complete